MMEEKAYAAKKAADMAYAQDIIQKINQDPRPGVLYKESRPIMDIKHMIETSLCLDQLPPSRYSTVYGSPREARLREGAYVGEVPTWRYWAANCSVTRP